MSRLFEALDLIKDELPLNISEFVKRLEEIEEEVEYMDAQDYESWRENPSKDGLEAYLRENFSDIFVENKKRRGICAFQSRGKTDCP